MLARLTNENIFDILPLSNKLSIHTFLIVNLQPWKRDLKIGHRDTNFVCTTPSQIMESLFQVLLKSLNVCKRSASGKHFLLKSVTDLEAHFMQMFHSGEYVCPVILKSLHAYRKCQIKRF
jgi:hypothetical protein